MVALPSSGRGGRSPPATPSRAFRLFALIQLIIEVIRIGKDLLRVAAVSMAFAVVVTGGVFLAQREITAVDNPVTTLTVCSPEPLLVDEPVVVSDPWTAEELDAMALTLAGECYEHKPQDKRRVCEVILNRVSDGGFGSSIIEVLSAENQFNGYWVQSRTVSENDYEVAEQALRDWYNGGCKALSKYLFFCAGDNLENEFRSEF